MGQGFSVAGTDFSYMFLNGTGKDKERMVLQGMRK